MVQAVFVVIASALVLYALVSVTASIITDRRNSKKEWELYMQGIRNNPFIPDYWKQKIQEDFG